MRFDRRIYAPGLALASWMVAACCGAHATAQDQDQVTIRLADRADLSLEALVRFAAETLDFDLMAIDSEFQGRTNQVKFYGELQVSKAVLIDLVQAVLRRNGLALVDSDVPNWKQVIPLANIRPFVPSGQAGDFKPSEYLTEIFQLKHVSPEIARQYINSILYASGGDQQTTGLVTEIASAKILIVTDLASRMQKVEELIQRVDVPQSQVSTRFIQVAHLEADELVVVFAINLAADEGE